MRPALSIRAAEQNAIAALLREDLLEFRRLVLDVAGLRNRVFAKEAVEASLRRRAEERRALREALFGAGR